MAEPRFIRIGAPSGDGPPEVQRPVPPAEPVPPEQAQPTVLPPEVFGVWAEESPPPAPVVRGERSGNGHGAPEPGLRKAVGLRDALAPRRNEPLRGDASPVNLRPGPPPAPATAPLRTGARVSHEDERLNEMRRSGRLIEAVCFDDLRLAGRLVAFDQYALILEIDGGESVVFKHGVIMLRYAD